MQARTLRRFVAGLERIQQAVAMPPPPDSCKVSQWPYAPSVPELAYRNRTLCNPQLADTTLRWNGLHPVFDLRFIVIIIVIITGCFSWWSIDLAERFEESSRLHGTGWHFMTFHHISCLTGKWQILLHKYVEVIVFSTVLHGLAGWPAVISGIEADGWICLPIYVHVHLQSQVG